MCMFTNSPRMVGNEQTSVFKRASHHPSNHATANHAWQIAACS